MDNIVNCNLTDLGFHGHKYTWSNKRYTNKNTLIKERLDCFLRNDQWLHTSPDSEVYHMYNGGSDHTPLLLNTFPTSHPTPPFLFEPMWLSYPSFPSLIYNTWSVYHEYFPALSAFQSKANIWNKYHFGDIFHKKRTLQKCLLGIQIALDKHFNPFLFNLQTQLNKDYHSILKQEELF